MSPRETKKHAKRDPRATRATWGRFQARFRNLNGKRVQSESCKHCKQKQSKRRWRLNTPRELGQRTTLRTRSALLRIAHVVPEHTTYSRLQLTALLLASLLLMAGSVFLFLGQTQCSAEAQLAASVCACAISSTSVCWRCD